jgi:hypothetical protein
MSNFLAIATLVVDHIDLIKALKVKVKVKVTKLFCYLFKPFFEKVQFFSRHLSTSTWLVNFNLATSTWLLQLQLGYFNFNKIMKCLLKN